MNKIFQLFFLLFCCANLSLAQDNNDAYVYIQGDKQTPFYVKMEGEMQPRLSKHYYIVNQLAGGATKFEILFQQNKYPPQQFIINVPASGARAFVLRKINEQQFALFDLEQNTSLMSGNKIEEDIIVTDPNKELREARIAKNNESDLPAFTAETEPSKKTKKTRSPKQEAEGEAIPGFSVTRKNTKETAESAAPEKKQEERFMEFELGKTSSTTSRKKTKSVAEETAAPAENSTPASNTTTNCTQQMSDEAFNNFAHDLSDRTDEETRLNYLKKYGVEKCYNTEQVRILALSFESQSSRYEVARTLKPRTVDANNYTKLLSIFNTNFIKNKFTKEVVNGE